MSPRRVQALGAALLGTAGLALLAPATVLAHNLSAVYESRLPLAVYLVGAAITVGLSFIFVLVRDVRADRPAPLTDGHLPPAGLRGILRVVGLIGWVWIVAQAVAGGSSDAAVAPLLLWVFGWVGIAFCSALLFPA